MQANGFSAIKLPPAGECFALVRHVRHPVVCTLGQLLMVARPGRCRGWGLWCTRPGGLIERESTVG